MQHRTADRSRGESIAFVGCGQHPPHRRLRGASGGPTGHGDDPGAAGSQPPHLRTHAGANAATDPSTRAFPQRFWADKVVDALDNPDLQVVVLSEGLPILDSGEADEPLGNPHLWLNPRLAMRYVERIRDTLSALDPAGEPAYRANATRYLQALEDLDAEIRRTVATFRTRDVVVFHPAWAYFFAEYGLHIAAVVQEAPGKEPTPQDIAAVVETLRRTRAGALFAEPQLPPQAATVIAAEAGVPVLYLDPLGGVPGREGYLDLMRYNLNQLARALGSQEETP